VDPPNLRWWDAREHGSLYQGWEETLSSVRVLLKQHAPVGVLGFSRGAILAAAVAALSEAMELPPIQFAIMIAGATPRATLLKPYFARTISVPSLHVWGETDRLMGERPAQLAEHFSPERRRVVTFPGDHVVPTRGSAADQIVEFIRERRAAGAPGRS
jgi:surfactin synthase thioesterase subunit